ncbi:hypothetical protein [Lysobacter gummosus]
MRCAPGAILGVAIGVCRGKRPKLAGKTIARRAIRRKCRLLVRSGISDES